MFMYADPHLQLELHRQRVAEQVCRAAEYRLARSGRRPRHRRVVRWPFRKGHGSSSAQTKGHGSSSAQTPVLP